MVPVRPEIRAILAERNVVLGPMAGVTEAPFRGICKRFGAGLTCTEMISAKGLHYNARSQAAAELLTLDRAEVPCAVQLFGAEPEFMAEGAQIVLDRLGPAVAAVDINMGCPVGKVVTRGEGSALMRTPDLAAEIVEAVRAAVDVPVTVKFRKGWDATSANAVEFAQRMEQAGAAAVAVHGRTRNQRYSGHADWDVIAAVKRAVSVPVIGSGDVMSAGDALAMIERTGVDAVMTARGSRGCPWIFAQARALIDDGLELPAPPPVERIDIAREHLAGLAALIGEHACARMRKHVAWYVHGLPLATRLRERVFATTSVAQMEALLQEYRSFLESPEAEHP